MNLNKNKFNNNHVISFISAIIFGIIAHGFIIFNEIPLGDTVVSIYGDGCLITSGRWLGWVIQNIYFKLFYNVTDNPTFFGTFTLITIAFCSVIIAKTFKIKNRLCLILLSGIMTTFTSMTVILSFMHMSYMSAISILLACLSLYFMTKDEFKYYLLSIFLGVLSISIYQSFIGFMILGYYIYLIFNYIKDNDTYLFLNRAIKYIVCSLLTLVLYIYTNKFVLWILNNQLSDWRNINSLNNVIGSFNLKDGIKNAYFYFFHVNYLNVFFEKLTYLFWIIIGIIVIIILIKVIKTNFQKQLINKVILIISVLLFPLVFNFLMLSYMDNLEMAVHSFYYQCLILIIPILIIELINNKYVKIFNIVLVSYFILYCIVISTTNYTVTYNYQESKKSYVNRLLSRIEQVDNFNTNMKYTILFNGENLYTNACLYYEYYPSNENYFDITNFSNNNCINKEFIYKWTSFELKILTDDKIIDEIYNSSEFKEMTYYPNDGSIKYFEEYNTIVVKAK